MNWKKFFLRMLKFIAIGTGICAVVMGGFGFYVGGKVGLVNGLTLGLILGVIGGSMTGLLGIAKFWGDYAGRYGKSYFDRQSGIEEPPQQKDKR